MELQEMRDRILAARPSGTLRIFGDWFGRPHDNIHRVVSVEARDDALVIGMDDGEELTVTDPRELELGDDVFRIRQADRVEFAWFAYGRPRDAENRYSQEHWVDGDRVRAISSVEWYQPSFAPSLSFPAVELDRGVGFE